MIKKISMLSLLGLLSVPAFAENTTTNNDNQLDTAAIFQALPSVIKAGTHTAAQNAEHQQYCDQFGAEDVTDNSDIHVGSDNIDPLDTVVICMGSGTGPSASLAGVGAASSLEEYFSNNPVGSGNGSSVNASPINGNVPINAEWWIQAYATYEYTMGGSARIAINGSVNGIQCGAFAAENIHTPTGFIRARQYCGAIYKTGYAQTWDHAWIIASNPSSSNVPGVINFVR